MRTLYLHVGPAKTGSSAIQHVLQSHDDSVVIYPKVGMTKVGSHHNLVRSFYGDYSRADTVRIDPDALLREITESVAASERDVLISSEMLPERKDIGKLIDAIAATMGGDSVAVELIVVCRDHFARAASAYNQKVKDVFHSECETPDAFLRRHSVSNLYAPLIRRLRRTGNKVTALNYHPSTGLVERFLRHVGFPDERIPPPEMLNVSLSPKALIATLAANNVAANAADRERYFAVLRKMPKFFASSVFIFSREAAEEADTRFEPDRRFLKREFGIEFPRRDAAGESGLFLDERDMTEIRNVTAELGAEGEAIAKFAAGYLRQ